ncbi:PEP-CTERM sorting domain-containing protein [Haloferula sp.]|uniref:PEP-CTERM sorting domain-containing protein n=1 Tax=Haloferula sp. TaxID=2497595 RepID=UPI00329E5620
MKANFKTKLLLSTAAAVVLIPVGNAVNVSWTGSGATDDWNDTANWNQTYAPGGNGTIDNAIFSGAGDNNTPTASFNYTVASDFNFRNEATLTLQSGVTISNIRNGRLGGNANNGGGHIIQTGGTLSGTTILVASSPTASTRSTHTMSGGAVTLTGQYDVNTLGDVILTGSSASVSAGSIDFSGASTLTFNFASSGIGSFSAPGAFNAAATSTMTINVGDYTPILGESFTLVDAGTLTGFDAANITVNGFGTAGIDYSLTQDLGSNGNIVLSVIPEPSAAALLGLGLSGLLLRRRRMI